MICFRLQSIYGQHLGSNWSLITISKKKDGKKEKVEESDGVITAVYRINMHCQQCAHEVEKPLRRIQGVQRVDVDIENNKITVKGKMDPNKIRARIEKTSDKRVELISSQPLKKDDKTSEKKEEKKEEKKDNKEPAVNTTAFKVQMHCEKCEHDLKRAILKFKGVHSVNTDLKAQTCTVEGIMDPHKLIEYLRKKAHKHAEILPQKQEKKGGDEKKIDGAKEGEVKKIEGRKGKEDESKAKEEKKQNETTTPYIIHYVYAPQLFSDDNPNACSLM